MTQSKRAACFLKSRIAILLENAGNAQTPGCSWSRKSWDVSFNDPVIPRPSKSKKCNSYSKGSVFRANNYVLRALFRPSVGGCFIRSVFASILFSKRISTE